MLSHYWNRVALLKRFFATDRPSRRQRREIAALYDDASMRERLREAQERINFDDTEMRDIVCQYIRDTPAMFDNLDNARERGDCREIFLYAHSIVGVAALLNIDEVASYAHIVEQNAKQQQCSDAASLHLLFEHHNASLDALKRLHACD